MCPISAFLQQDENKNQNKNTAPDLGLAVSTDTLVAPQVVFPSLYDFRL